MGFVVLCVGRCRNIKVKRNAVGQTQRGMYPTREARGTLGRARLVKTTQARGARLVFTKKKVKKK